MIPPYLQNVVEYDRFRRRYSKDAAGHEHAADSGQFVSSENAMNAAHAAAGSAKNDNKVLKKTTNDARKASAHAQGKTTWAQSRIEHETAHDAHKQAARSHSSAAATHKNVGHHETAKHHETAADAHKQAAEHHISTAEKM